MKALFRAVDNEHADAETSERCCYKKGDFVVVVEDAQTWGAKEGPPSFVSVSCPEITVEQARGYLDGWELRPNYEVLASNEQGWRVRITSELPGALNEAGIPIATARSYLEGQGCQFVSSAADNIVVDVPNTADIEDIKEKLNNVVGRPHRRKRWCVSEACIDWALAQGSIDVPATKAQLQTYLTDKAS
jgi:hypothetical protein